MSLQRMGAAACLLCVWSLIVSPALAAPPSDDWRTLETERFRFHVPAEAEPWARRIAQDSEGLADEVHELVGYEPEGRIDVLVVDPFNQPNGMAVPILGKSRMVLFTTPPASDSVIGHYARWDELLFIHEQAHLAHLARPPRGPLGWRWRQLWLPLGLGPLVQEPMWMIEGYATWVEGKLTGRGRPNSDFRDGLIRQWALEGRLPSYSAVSRPSRDDWMARTMAYLVGSAYFQWLEAREGPEAFQDVWARATAREGRSFSDAFKGVFGDTPASLYARFTAEMTQQALNREAALADDQRWGRLWQDYSGHTGDLAVSPDGEYVALVERRPRRASELKILKLDDNEERFERWHEQQEAMLERDPDDVKAVEPDSLPRSPVHRLPGPQARDIQHPRWIPGQSALLFSRFTVDARGQQQSDLFRWDYEADEVVRLTQGAGLHRADPAPDGEWAVAVRKRHGQSQLVRVSLSDGRIKPITPPTLDEVHDYPRLHPDGEYLAYMRHQDGRWQLRERNLADGEERLLVDSRGEDFLSHPSWSADGDQLFFTRGRNGHLDLFRLDRDSGAQFQLTRSPHIAFLPQHIPEQDSLLYLSHGRGGMRVMKLETMAPSPVADSPTMTAEASPVDEDRPSVPLDSRPYGAGPQYASALLGLRWHRSERSLDLGVRGGDPVGRLDWLMAATHSSQGSLDGAVAAVGWHGWPARLDLSLFRVDEAPGEQSDLPETVQESLLDQRQQGLRLGSAYRHQLGLSHWRLQGGITGGRLKRDGVSVDRDWLDLGTAFQGRWRRGDWRLDGGLEIEAWRGQTDNQRWQRDDWQISLGGGFRDTRIHATWRQSQLDDDALGLEMLRLGGQSGTVNRKKTQPLTHYEPAIAAARLRGQVYERQSLSLRGRSNTRLFHRRHRMGMEDADEGAWLNVTGFEVSMVQIPSMLALPEVRGLAFNLGLGRIHGEELEGHRRAWFNLRYEW